jgi:5-formyltetrahydrofolate cyclo-ligase
VAGKIAANDSPKAALRKQIIAARDALSAATRHDLSTRITQELLKLNAYRNAACVLAYMSFGSEFNTGILVADALASGKQLCLPRVNRDTRRLEVHRVENIDRDLQPGVWGIREPLPGRPHADFDRIDFVLLPGVAFTPRCERLGYGGGFYDRLIAQFTNRPPLVAAAFALQVREQIPLAVNDQRIDVVVTENSLYRKC